MFWRFQVKFDNRERDFTDIPFTSNYISIINEGIMIETNGNFLLKLFLAFLFEKVQILALIGDCGKHVLSFLVVFI